MAERGSIPPTLFKGLAKAFAAETSLLSAIAATALTASVITIPIASSAEASKQRAISLYNIHTRDNITLVYKKNGKYLPSALKKLNWFLRDWRQDREIKIDPKLFDLLADIHKELGSERPIHVISAYRSPKTNAMLRKKRGGQARKSYHMRGMAIDVHFPDVSVRQLRYSALIRERGGVGYYPTSSIPFVHVDTGRVRHWPRMHRHELALLFRRARTRHIPSDGKPLTRADVAAARKARPNLAIKVASFHDIRRYGPKRDGTWAAGTRIARASPPKQPALPPVPSAQPVPKLVAPPRLAATAAAGSGLSRQLVALGSRDAEGSADGRRLDQLASLATSARSGPNGGRATPRGSLVSRGLTIPPRVLRETPLQTRTDKPGRQVPARGRAPTKPLTDTETSWIPAPQFDEDHSEELFYTPFRVSPYLTDTPSVDDDALVVMRHPDAVKTLAMLPESGGQPMTRFVRGRAIGTVRAALAFKGGAVRVAVNMLPPPEPITPIPNPAQ